MSGTLIPVPVWFVRQADDHRPALLQLPSSLCWFQAPDGAACWVDGVAWIPVHDRVVAVPLPGPPEEVATEPDLVLRGTDGTSVRVTRDGLLVAPASADRIGADLRLTREGAQWSAPWELVDGARRSPRAWPFGTGLGLVWTDSGWVYRQRQGQAPVPLGPITSTERLLAGPQGAVLIGDDQLWTRAASATGTMLALEAPLAVDGPVRWAPDGEEVAGWTHPDPDDTEVVSLDLHTGAVHMRVPHAVPMGHDCVAAAGDPDVPGRAMRAADVAREGQLLGGPGGMVWNLDVGAPCTPRPILGPGPHLPMGRVWLTHDGGGAVRWIDPRKGKTTAHAQVPLSRFDEIASLVVRDAGAEVRTLFGETHWVPLPPGVVHEPARKAAARPRRCAPRWRNLGFSQGVRRKDRVYAWSPDGLLAVLPDDAIPTRP